jgi:predicted ATPase
MEIIDPSPFSVFIGANGAGKSNVFEALAFVVTAVQLNLQQAQRLYGGAKDFLNRSMLKQERFIFSFAVDFGKRVSANEVSPSFLNFSVAEEEVFPSLNYLVREGDNTWLKQDMILGSLTSLNRNTTADSRHLKQNLHELHPEYFQFYDNFSHIFIGKSNKVKLNTDSDDRLKIDGSNLEKVLRRLLANDTIKEEILEWMGLFIPEFENIRIHSDNISGNDTLLIYMKGSEQPFDKSLISDGTFNILCLLVAVYQSDKPQFLCIEEPETGLNPYVIRQLVSFLRDQCKEKGHHIWLNTHSQTLVSQLAANEVILVDKKEGATQVKQFKEEELHGLSMDEAWLTNALGGGLPW